MLTSRPIKNFHEPSSGAYPSKRVIQYTIRHEICVLLGVLRDLLVACLMLLDDGASTLCVPDLGSLLIGLFGSGPVRLRQPETLAQISRPATIEGLDRPSL